MSMSDTTKTELKVGCQTYTWEMLGDGWQGTADDLLDVRALLQSLPEETPEDKQRKLAAQVQLLRDNGQYADAYALQGELVREAPGDADLLYDHAMLAEKTGEATRLNDALIAATLRLFGVPDALHARALAGERLPAAELGRRRTASSGVLMLLPPLAARAPNTTYSAQHKAAASAYATVPPSE